jgi:hypothetical protein
MARYYSRRNVSTKMLFADLFKIWGEGTSRALSDNRYLMEFETDKCLTFVLRGGPWKFKGDALIFVRYNGLAKCSEVAIESIPLWNRIYDIHIAMMATSFAPSLGTKVERVLEVGETVMDFKSLSGL